MFKKAFRRRGPKGHTKRENHRGNIRTTACAVKNLVCGAHFPSQEGRPLTLMCMRAVRPMVMVSGLCMVPRFSHLRRGGGVVNNDFAHHVGVIMRVAVVTVRPRRCKRDFPGVTGGHFLWAHQRNFRALGNTVGLEHHIVNIVRVGLGKDHRVPGLYLELSGRKQHIPGVFIKHHVYGVIRRLRDLWHNPSHHKAQQQYGAHQQSGFFHGSPLQDYSSHHPRCITGQTRHTKKIYCTGRYAVFYMVIRAGYGSLQINNVIP